MINGLLGAPGGGKSYEAVVFHVLPALNAGRLVITNLPLDVPYIYSVIPEAIGLIRLVHPSKENPIPFSTLQDYGDSWRHPESGIGPLYIIDECHKALPRGRTRIDVEEWFAEHRHEHADVLLLTQSYGKVSRPIVDLFQLIYRVRKNVALGSSSSYVRKVQDGIRGEVVNQSIRRYDPANYKFYKSHTKSNTAATEAYASDIKPIWQHWSVIGAGLFLLVAAYMAITGRMNPFPKTTALPKHQPVAQGMPRTKPALTPAPSSIGLPHPMADKDGKEQMPAVSHPYYKVQLHIAGFIRAQTGRRFLYNIYASQNGQKVFEMTSDDLLLAGYKITVINPCALKIDYERFSDYLVCDAPQVAVQMAGGSMTSTPSVAQQAPQTMVVGSEDQPRDIDSNWAHGAVGNTIRKDR